jgi:predicted lipid-binding transport protein (Tim44 family)
MNDPRPVGDGTGYGDGDDRLRRLQIGIAGLVAVLLLVGLAGIISDRAGPPAANTTDGTVKAAGTEPSEPLAELGVQPTAPEEAPAAAPPSGDVPVAAGKAVPDLRPDPELQRARDAAKK